MNNDANFYVLVPKFVVWKIRRTKHLVLVGKVCKPRMLTPIVGVTPQRLDPFEDNADVQKKKMFPDRDSNPGLLGESQPS